MMLYKLCCHNHSKYNSKIFPKNIPGFITEADVDNKFKWEELDVGEY